MRTEATDEALRLCVWVQGKCTDYEIRGEDPGPWRDMLVIAWRIYEDARR